MQVDQKMVRELQKKFELELNKREIEITDTWRKELDLIYKRKYENLNAMLSDIRTMIGRMTNRITILTKMVKEGE